MAASRRLSAATTIQIRCVSVGALRGQLKWPTTGNTPVHWGNTFLLARTLGSRTSQIKAKKAHANRSSNASDALKFRLGTSSRLFLLSLWSEVHVFCLSSSEVLSRALDRPRSIKLVEEPVPAS